MNFEDPDYPNEASKAYRNQFLMGAAMAGLTDIPDDVLSWAIDRCIASKRDPKDAGRIFADTYFSIQTRRAPRSGYWSPTAYLLKAFENELGEEKSARS